MPRDACATTLGEEEEAARPSEATMTALLSHNDRTAEVHLAAVTGRTNQRTRLWVDDESGRRASATVASDGRVATISFAVPCGTVSSGVRTALVRSVFQLPAVRGCRAIRVSTPLGDFELLDQLRRYLPRARTRAAGSTCLIDAYLTLDGGSP
jgi:hypothetical protein